MAKTSKYSASTWRKLDAAYRKKQKELRAANAARRKFWEDIVSLVDAGFSPSDFNET